MISTAVEGLEDNIPFDTSNGGTLFTINLPSTSSSSGSGSAEVQSVVNVEGGKKKGTHASNENSKKTRRVIPTVCEEVSFKNKLEFE